jgi:serine racemase
VHDLVGDIILVDDNAIVNAIKMCYEILKVVVEYNVPRNSRREFKESSACHGSSKMGIIVSGRNIDLSVLLGVTSQSHDIVRY